MKRRDSGRAQSWMLMILAAGFLAATGYAILDLDNNGSSDIWEEYYGQSLPANEDPDNDGATNKQEYDRGTNPLLPDHSYETIAIANDPLEGLKSELRFFGGIARTFTVEETTDLVGVPWSEAGTVPGADATILMEEAINSDKKFFRVDPQGADPDGEPAGKEDQLDGVEEHLLGTSNTSADSDGDGLGDRFEAIHRNEGFDPNDPSNPNDPNADPDNDGLTNAEEEEAGTRAAGEGAEDTDGDGVLDGEDGWALDAGMSPPRLPDVSYAVIEANQPGYGVIRDFNNNGDLLLASEEKWVNVGSSLEGVWEAGYFTALPDDYSWDSINDSLTVVGVRLIPRISYFYFFYEDYFAPELYKIEAGGAPEQIYTQGQYFEVSSLADFGLNDPENFLWDYYWWHTPHIVASGDIYVTALGLNQYESGEETIDETIQGAIKFSSGNLTTLGDFQSYDSTQNAFNEEAIASIIAANNSGILLGEQVIGLTKIVEGSNATVVSDIAGSGSESFLVGYDISDGTLPYVLGMTDSNLAIWSKVNGSWQRIYDPSIELSSGIEFPGYFSYTNFPQMNSRAEIVGNFIQDGTTGLMVRNGKVIEASAISENYIISKIQFINEKGMLAAYGKKSIPVNPGDENERPLILLPMELIVSPVEAEEDDGTPVKYYVSADEAEVPLFGDILAGEMDPHDNTVIAWEITDGTGGSLGFAETNFSDGITSNTLTTSTNPGDTYQITGRVKNLVLDPDESTADDEFRLDVEAMGYDKVTGMELVTAIIEVVPGLTNTIGVSTSETELKADGTSELTVTATLTDQFGNTVAEDTWVNWNLEGDGELIEIDNTTDASGQVTAKLIAGTAAGNQKIILEADSTVKVETITNTELTSSLTSDKSSLDMATGETATLTASFSGVEDGAAVTWHTTKGEIINASSTISGGSATATLRSVETRTGDAIVTAAVGNKNAATHVNFTTTGPISISIDDPVIAGDATSDGTVNVPRIDGTNESVAYKASTSLHISAPSYAGQMATVSILRSDPDPLEGYPMDEINGGSTPNDDGFNHATVNGAVLDTTIKQSGAASIHFDGDDTLTSLDGMRLQIADGLTVNAWVNPETDADGGQIVNKPGEYDLAIDSAGQITFTVTTTTGTHSVTSPVIAEVDQWSSVKARYTLSEIALTVNGQTTTQSITGNFTAGVSHVVMGNSFTGNLDEITFSYGSQLTGGLPLSIQGLDGNGQIQLDGSGNATLTVASDGSMGSSDSPELGAVQVSINPTLIAASSVITAPSTQIAIMEAAAGQVKISTSGTDRALTDAEREEYVARMFEEIRETGDLSSGLRLIPGGSLDNRQEFAFRAALIMETNSTGATNTRIIFEATGDMTSIPQEEITSLQDQITRMLMDALQQGSDANFEQHFTDTHGDLIAGLAAITSTNEEAFEGFTRVIDGDIAWQNAQEVYEFGGEELIEDIGQIAHDETEGPSIGRYMLDMLAAFDNLVPSSYQQQAFNNLSDFVRNQVNAGVANENIAPEVAVWIGYQWGIIQQLQALGSMTNPLDATKMYAQLASIAIGAATGDEEAQEALMNMIPIYGTIQSGSTAITLYEQGQYFDSGVAGAEFMVGAVGDAAMVYGAVKVGMSMVRIGRAVPGGRPPRIPASFGKATTQDYKKTFFDANPQLQGQGHWVHHAVPRDAIKKGWITWEEGHSLQNLRGIPLEINRDIHLSKIAKAWNNFKKKYPQGTTPPKQDLLDFATEIDDLYGHLFDPPVR